MKFKLDENLDHRLVSLFSEFALDAETVHQENLSGASDKTLFTTCQNEDRILVTLDLDFANPLVFPPANTCGIIVLRPFRPVITQIQSLLSCLLPTIKPDLVNGKLVIVEPGRMRFYDPVTED